ncbi:MAG: HIT family protein [Flavobacteriales bacterium]
MEFITACEQLVHGPVTPEEQGALPAVLDLAKAWIEKHHTPAPDGYNVGMNCGEAAGQTVMHFHCHLIPRRS